MDAGFAIQGLQLRGWAVQHQNAGILAQPRGDIDRQGIQPRGGFTMGRPKETIRQVTRKAPSLWPCLHQQCPLGHPARKVMRAARIVRQCQRLEQNAMDRTDIEQINLPFCPTAGSTMIHNVSLHAARAELQCGAVEKGSGEIAASELEAARARWHAAVCCEVVRIRPGEIGQILQGLGLKLQDAAPGQPHDRLQSGRAGPQRRECPDR
nr:hypothetical protein [Fuscovulum blasticum]